MALTTHLVLAQSHSRFTLHFLTTLMTIFVLSIILQSKQVSAEAKTDECVFGKYGDSNQEELDKAKQRISALIGHTYTSYDENSYKYTVGICTHVDNNDDKDTSVLQEKLDENGKPILTDTHKIGSLKDTHIMVGTDWVILEYRDGEKYGTHCDQEGKRTVIMITCDEHTDDSEAKMVFMKEENSKSESCYYLFEMKHEAVCPIPGSTGLSVGSILLIVFFSVLAVYIFIGFLYQRFVLGSKGVEQIPNYELWKDFGNLQADGCDLVCRTKGRQRTGHIHGLGDDQLDPSEEIRDDNLLPM